MSLTAHRQTLKAAIKTYRNAIKDARKLPEPGEPDTRLDDLIALRIATLKEIDPAAAQRLAEARISPIPVQPSATPPIEARRVERSNSVGDETLKPMSKSLRRTRRLADKGRQRSASLDKFVAPPLGSKSKSAPVSPTRVKHPIIHKKSSSFFGSGSNSNRKLSRKGSTSRLFNYFFGKKPEEPVTFDPKNLGRSERKAWLREAKIQERVGRIEFIINLRKLKGTESAASLKKFYLNRNQNLQLLCELQRGQFFAAATHPEQLDILDLKTDLTLAYETLSIAEKSSAEWKGLIKTLHAHTNALLDKTMRAAIKDLFKNASDLSFDSEYILHAYNYIVELTKRAIDAGFDEAFYWEKRSEAQASIATWCLAQGKQEAYFQYIAKAAYALEQIPEKQRTAAQTKQLLYWHEVFGLNPIKRNTDRAVVRVRKPIRRWINKAGKINLKAAEPETWGEKVAFHLQQAISISGFSDNEHLLDHVKSVQADNPTMAISTMDVVLQSAVYHHLDRMAYCEREFVGEIKTQLYAIDKNTSLNRAEKHAQAQAVLKKAGSDAIRIDVKEDEIFGPQISWAYVPIAARHPHPLLDLVNQISPSRVRSHFAALMKSLTAKKPNLAEVVSWLSALQREMTRGINDNDAGSNATHRQYYQFLAKKTPSGAFCFARKTLEDLYTLFDGPVIMTIIEGFTDKYYSQASEKNPLKGYSSIATNLGAFAFALKDVLKHEHGVEKPVDTKRPAKFFKDFETTSAISEQEKQAIIALAESLTTKEALDNVPALSKLTQALYKPKNFTLPRSATAGYVAEDLNSSFELIDSSIDTDDNATSSSSNSDNEEGPILPGTFGSPVNCHKQAKNSEKNPSDAKPTELVAANA